MSLQSKQDLAKKLKKKSYRDAFVASRIAQTIAFQLRVLRQRKDLSQADLAKELGTSQNAVSRIENPRYGKPSISTLRKIASFFDVGLIVRFAPLSEIADWTTTLSERAVDVPDFEHDTGFLERKSAASEDADTHLALGKKVVNDILGATYQSGEIDLGTTSASAAAPLAGTTGKEVVIRSDKVIPFRMVRTMRGEAHA